MSNQWEESDVAAACGRAWHIARETGGGIDPELVIRELSRFEASDAEKLRWFAIWLEENVLPDWDFVRDLYAEALRRDPRDERVGYSWAVAAHRYVDFVPEEERGAMRAEALRLAERAVQCSPSDADAHHLLGLVLYANEDCSIVSAEAAFRAAVRLRPDFSVARLYLAHTLQDAGQWNEAWQELQKVDESKLLLECGPSQRWRVAKRREMLAVCLLHLGRREEAERAVWSFLALVEHAGPRDVEVPSQLVELSSLLSASLAERVRAISTAFSAT